MQFIVTGHDLPDALPRRLEVRQKHIDLCNEMKARGEMHYGVALIDDSGNMKGSVVVVDFPDRAGLDAYLAREPYVTARVWGKIEVLPCKIGPSFVKAA
jgi:uncharacterized protein YciI